LCLSKIPLVFLARSHNEVYAFLQGKTCRPNIGTWWYVLYAN